MESLIEGNTLLVGEGDFSFAVSMVEKLPSNKCACIIATSLETSDSINKHQYAARNISLLQEKGVTVRLDTDATQLHLNQLTKGEKFSCIIFNFPHVGGKSNHKKNRKLLNDFFASAVQVLESEGQVMMTLCKGQGGTPADRPMRAWHDSWQVVSMAANSGLILTKIIPFKADEYRVYTSTGFRSLDKGFNTENALTHVFEVAEPVNIPVSTDDIRIKLGNSIYLCRPYIYRKLLQIKCINCNKDHPVHRVYETFLKCLTYNTTNKVENHGLQYPLKGSPTNVSSCENRLTFTGCHGYKLVKLNVTDSIKVDDDLSDLIDEAEIIKGTQSVNDVSLGGNQLAFSDPMELGIIRLKYGPDHKPCEISVNQSPVSYFMTLAWPVSIGHDTVGDLDLHKCELIKVVNEVTSKITQILDDVLMNSKQKVKIKRSLEEKTQFLTDVPENILHVADICICDKSVNSQDCTLLNTENNEQPIKIGDCKMKLIKNNIQADSIIVTVYITIDLCKVACSVYSIENERLLWSDDTRGLFSQLDLNGQDQSARPENKLTQSKHGGIDFDKNAQEVFDIQVEGAARGCKNHLRDFGIRSPSLYPMTFVHDMSFWENKDVPFCMLEYCDIIRDVAGDSVINIQLLDTYTDSVTGKTSRCYRLTFQSVDKALSYDTSWKLQSLIRLEVEKKMKIELR